MSNLRQKDVGITMHNTAGDLNTSTPPISMMQYYPNISNLSNLSQPLNTQYISHLGQAFSYTNQSYLNQEYDIRSSIEQISNYCESELTILEHVFRCSSIFCTQECSEMKMKIHHVMMCSGISCPICSKIQVYFSLHQERCSLPDCAVPNFKYLNRLFADLKSDNKKEKNNFSKENVNKNEEMSYPRLPSESNQVSKRSYLDTSIYSESYDSHINKKIQKSYNLVTYQNHLQQQQQQQQQIIKKANPNVEEEEKKVHVHLRTALSSNAIPVIWIKCNLCGKKRKVPNTLDTQSFRSSFKCSINIWDCRYLSCDIPEEIVCDKKRSVIDLTGHYSGYEEEKEKFMEILKAFHRTNQTGVIVKIPTLGRKQVDLYRLFREVTSYGGATSVVLKEGTWARIYRGLDNFSTTETSASFRLKKMYNKYLYAYEQYLFNFDNSNTDLNISTTPRLGQSQIPPQHNILPKPEITQNENERIGREAGQGEEKEEEQQQIPQKQNINSINPNPTVPTLDPQIYEEFDYGDPSVYAYCPYYNIIPTLQHKYDEIPQNGWICKACNKYNKESQKYCIFCQGIKP